MTQFVTFVGSNCPKGEFIGHYRSLALTYHVLHLLIDMFVCKTVNSINFLVYMFISIFATEAYMCLDILTPRYKQIQICILVPI